MTNPKSHRFLGTALVGATAWAATLVVGAPVSGPPAGGPATPEARTESMAATSLAGVAGDTDAWHDADGMLLYADRDLGAAETGEGDALANAHNPARPAPYAYDQTFRLHSLPGAAKVAYLDFDGDTIADSAWNATFSGGAPFDVGGYDVDGNPSAFSTTELDAVQEIWQRVSEDFAAFQIDVTTEAPAPDAIDRIDSGDTRFGTHLVVTNTTTIYSSCGCGGVSYVGAFNYVNPGDPSKSHAYYQPGYVFQNGVGTAPKTIAEAATHEIGHSLGLSHDATATSGGYTGQGDWAPIMGTGYSRPVTQWSRGEFAGSTNQEDDLAVIQAHGLAPVADDVGDTPGSAVSLTAGGGVAEGVISTSADRDVYSFTTPGGPLTITVSPNAVSPDLDARIDLLDASGNVLASADPASTQVSEDFADGMGATLRTSTTAGTLYVSVDGVGSGDPLTTGYSDYASLGHYRLSVSAGSGANAAPSAAASASTTSGRGPLTITLSSDGSTDSDGSIVSRHWDFGDGASSDEPNPTHTFEAAGSYAATVTVTDDQGGTATATQPITVTESGNRISSLELTLIRKTRSRSAAHASLSMISPTGAPLGRALVLGAWSGSDKRWVLGITDNDGRVSFDSLSASRGRANYSFTVLWAGYLEAPGDWQAESSAVASVWNGGPQYWAATSPK